MRTGRLITAVALFLGVAWLNGTTQAADSSKFQPNLPMQFSATAIGQAGMAAGKSFGLTVYVQGLTTDGETEELVATLKHKGQDGLVSAMQDIGDKGLYRPDGLGRHWDASRSHTPNQGWRTTHCAGDRSADLSS